MARPRPAP
jgi:glutathione S-transferase